MQNSFFQVTFWFLAKCKSGKDIHIKKPIYEQKTTFGKGRDHSALKTEEKIHFHNVEEF